MSLLIKRFVGSQKFYVSHKYCLIRQKNMAINISDFRELASDAYNLLRLFLKTISLSAD